MLANSAFQSDFNRNDSALTLLLLADGLGPLAAAGGSSSGLLGYFRHCNVNRGRNLATRGPALVGFRKYHRAQLKRSSEKVGGKSR